MKIIKYELRDELGDLIRVFDSHEQAVKMLTVGDVIVQKTIDMPKLSGYAYAIKKVGYADL